MVVVGVTNEGFDFKMKNLKRWKGIMEQKKSFFAITIGTNTIVQTLWDKYTYNKSILCQSFLVHIN